ncbi:type 1 glutamine amidotransferase domain-containing protein [Actinophytocola xinjiangensis]|nr:type 1 glutamine amidotransferase domain-containing protein [Actinophytocola xinjiangensis]
MGRILLAVSSHDVLGDTGQPTGYSVSEAAHPYRVFVDAGYEVDFVSVRGGLPPAVVFDGEENDPEVQAYLADETIQAALAATPPASEVSAEGYDAIFYAGGHGAMWDFPDSPDLARLAMDIYAAGGIVSAVCHGPAALVNLRLPDGRYLVEGKRVSSFTNEEEDSLGLVHVMPFLLEDRLKERGGLHGKSGNFVAHTSTDDRVITGQNPPSAAIVAELVVRELKNTAS